MKFCNEDGGKGVGMRPVCMPVCASTADRQRTGRCDSKDASAILRGGVQMSTELLFLTQRAREDPKHRFTSLDSKHLTGFTRLMDLLTEDFLKECFRG